MGAVLQSRPFLGEMFAWVFERNKHGLSTLLSASIDCSATHSRVCQETCTASEVLPVLRACIFVQEHVLRLVFEGLPQCEVQEIPPKDVYTQVMFHNLSAIRITVAMRCVKPLRPLPSLRVWSTKD